MYAAVLLCLVCADPIEFSEPKTCIDVQGDRLAAVGAEYIEIANLNSGDVIDKFPADKETLDVLWCGKYIVTTGPNGTSVFEDGELKDALDPGMMLATDGKTLCVRALGGTLYTFSTQSFAPLKELEHRHGHYKTCVGLVCKNNVCAEGNAEGGAQFRVLSKRSARGSIHIRDAELTRYTTDGDWHIVVDKDATKCVNVQDRGDPKRLCEPGFPIFASNGNLLVFGLHWWTFSKDMEYVKREKGVGTVTDADFWKSDPVVLVDGKAKVLE